MDSGGVYQRDHDLVWDGVSYFGQSTTSSFQIFLYRFNGTTDQLYDLLYETTYWICFDVLWSV